MLHGSLPCLYKDKKTVEKGRSFKKVIPLSSDGSVAESQGWLGPWKWLPLGEEGSGYFQWLVFCCFDWGFKPTN